LVDSAFPSVFHKVSDNSGSDLSSNTFSPGFVTLSPCGAVEATLSESLNDSKFHVWSLSSSASSPGLSTSSVYIAFHGSSGESSDDDSSDWSWSSSTGALSP